MSSEPRLFFDEYIESAGLQLLNGKYILEHWEVALEVISPFGYRPNLKN